MTQEQLVAAPSGNRVRVFVDFWNLQITMNNRIAQTSPGSRFRFDWARLPRWLASVGADICGHAPESYEGAHVYASWNPYSEGDRRLRDWMLDWLDRQPGSRSTSGSAVAVIHPHVRYAMRRLRSARTAGVDWRAHRRRVSTPR